jgi:hypothetical protein
MDADRIAGEVADWLAARAPAGWFAGRPEVAADGEEILVMVRLAAPALPPGTGQAAASAACLGRIKEFRERTREQRMRLAAELEHHHGRKVSWGAACGDQQGLFTTLSVPVMTRLRLRERAVLDTLIEAGVARSRSDALAWCVRLVGTHQAEWIRDLQAALIAVKKVRSEGPTSR